MALNICPSLFYITPDINTKPYNKNDIFMTDRFKILQKDRTHIDKVIANTGFKQTLEVRLLSCYLVKDKSESYCTHRRIDNTNKRTHEFIHTEYVHFHLKMKNTHDTEYFIAFIEGAYLDDDDKKETLTQELFHSIEWLGISTKHIIFNIFTIEHPVFITSTIKELDVCINSIVKKMNYPGEIECCVSHIKMTENLLAVSLKKNFLSFQVSFLSDDQFFNPVLTSP